MDEQLVSTMQMQGHLADGHAEALLPSGTPGPVRWQGRWWAVRTGDTHYRPVDPDAAAVFDREARRLDAYRAHRASGIAVTGQRRE